MDQGQKKQVDEIMAWFKEIFRGDLVLAFDVKDSMLPVLQQLMEKNKKANTDAMLITKELSRNAEYYDHKAKGLDIILNNCGILIDTLSQDSKKSISCLSAAAHALNIDEPSNAGFILAITEAHNERIKVENTLEEEKKIMEKLGFLLQKQLSLVSTLENLHIALEEQNTEDDQDGKEKSKRTSFLQHKTKEYTGNIAILKNELIAAGLVPQLKHAQLAKTSEDLKAMKRELAEKKKQLYAYRSIAPNTHLAKIGLEEARRELESLESKLTNMIDFMHT